MKKVLSLIVLAGVFFASPAFAADPIVGTWKLNVAKSKFTAGSELTAGTRVYTEAIGLYTLDQKLTGTDGKETSNRAQYRDGKEEKQGTAGPADTTLGKKIDANTWDFDLKKDGKVVGHVHRVVSADGKTLTVHNTGMQLSGATGNTTLVFDKQWGTRKGRAHTDVRTLARTYAVACPPPRPLPADALWGEIRRPQKGSCACYHSRPKAVMAPIRADSLLRQSQRGEKTRK